jgi:hypothetical protein
MTVAPPNDALKADLESFGKVIAGEWRQKAGAAGAAVLKACEAK